jgi:hypothetical protein
MIIFTPVITYTGYQLLNSAFRLPCLLLWWFWGPIASSFAPIIVIRATILLFQVPCLCLPSFTCYRTSLVLLVSELEYT